MEWRVVKTGAEMFDALHACGLGILIAAATGTEVQLCDRGVMYHLSCPIDRVPRATAELLQEVLAVPTIDEVLALENDPDRNSLAIASLDGLLAALITSPGPRIPSVYSLLARQQLVSSSVETALSKVVAARKRWLVASAGAAQAAGDWLETVLESYAGDRPRTARPVETTRSAVSVLLSIDPQWSFSSRRATSDGLVTQGSNVTIDGTPDAPILAIIGAARFLRAQNVAGTHINFYVPCPDSITLSADTALPLLRGTEQVSSHALAAHWILGCKENQITDDRMAMLAYHVVQLQGMRAPTSSDRGCLNTEWLQRVLRQAGTAPITYWRELLNSRQAELVVDLDGLVDCLTTRRRDRWVAHLVEMAMKQPDSKGNLRPYSLHEVREVIKLMSNAQTHPLSSIMDRHHGTLRFGHALRQLSQHNGVWGVDLRDALDTVQTRDQLISVAARIAQTCQVSNATSQFAIIPSDTDLKYLLDDVEMHGSRTIAKMLIVLSSLHYPKTMSPKSSRRKYQVVWPISQIDTTAMLRRKRG